MLDSIRARGGTVDMDPYAKKIALLAFASVLSTTPLANADLNDFSHDELVDDRVQQIFESFWNAGLIKIDPQSGKLIVNEDLLEAMKASGQIDHLRFSSDSPDTSNESW